MRIDKLVRDCGTIATCKDLIGTHAFLLKQDKASKAYLNSCQQECCERKELKDQVYDYLEDADYTISLHPSNFIKRDLDNFSIMYAVVKGHKHDVLVSIKQEYFDYFTKQGFTFRVAQDMFSSQCLGIVQLIKKNEACGIVLPVRISNDDTVEDMLKSYSIGA